MAKKPVIYTNWRGKQFSIEEIIEDIKRQAIEDGEDLKDYAEFTPEYVCKLVGLIESVERHKQLEAMWQQSEGRQK